MSIELGTSVLFTGHSPPKETVAVTDDGALVEPSRISRAPSTKSDNVKRQGGVVEHACMLEILDTAGTEQVCTLCCMLQCSGDTYAHNTHTHTHPLATYSLVSHASH